MKSFRSPMCFMARSTFFREWGNFIARKSKALRAACLNRVVTTWLFSNATLRFPKGLLLTKPLTRLRNRVWYHELGGAERLDMEFHPRRPVLTDNILYCVCV